MTLMTTSNEGLSLIKKYEGLKLKAYKCPAGIWTIGYGHTQGVTPGMAINESAADGFLKQDARGAEQVLNKLGINFAQNQFDALVSWIFNLGAGSFNTSTLKKKIVAKAADEEITDQIIKWVNAAGKPLLGLKKRRVEEANMFLGKTRYAIDSKERIVKV